MTNNVDDAAPRGARLAGAPSLSVPTGLQANAELSRRRLIMMVLNVVTWLAMLWLAAKVLGAGGWTIVDIIMFVCFAFGTPWTVVGFWNSVIGLWLLHFHKDPMGAVAPYAGAGDVPTPITIKTAVFMTLRNEDPARAIRRLRIVKESIDATGEGAAFSYFVLSDTNRPEVAAAEEAAIAAWKAQDPDAARITYRRREENKGYKAGNVRDFCERWGKDYELMLPLDADSVMSGPAIVRLVRMMQAHPRIGILQSLVVGMPSSSAFARIFQFGMRHGMRSYTMGQAWWVGDCGPFWGHNAVVRIKPFVEDCDLPLLPGKPPLGGHVLSHDQVEATLMRRAGYEVRVLPVENGSWEENPPTMLDFAQRDVRWCQGNMQYIKLLDLPGLYAMSRFQLLWAILMFIGIPAWTLMIALLPIAAWEGQSIANYPVGLAIFLYVLFFVMYLSPKIAGLIDAVLTKGGVARYGGPVRFAVSAALELVFSFLQGAISTIRTSIFMIGLAFGKSVVWGGQSRDAYGISWATAVRNLWPQTLFGIVVCGLLWLINPAVFWWSLPLTAGYLVAVPFAVLTASPALGRWFKQIGLAGIPEDFEAPPEIRAVQEASA
ncbi:MAG: glucans biosynthesis glucosyltransferase MdoH [Hyphomicrobium sp.]|nr:glucans biosynthesis glucosyltransferase MdoH [Hyphomicrobium sp.]MBN9279556.1 glucans biosynthesis glucosyltransferase MdoH [Hyphomicrobium sp.]